MNRILLKGRYLCTAIAVLMLCRTSEALELASRVVTVNRSPDYVWTKLSSFEEYPLWALGVTKVTWSNGPADQRILTIHQGRNEKVEAGICQRNRQACEMLEENRSPRRPLSLRFVAATENRELIFSGDRDTLDVPESFEPARKTFEIVVQVRPDSTQTKTDVVVHRAWKDDLADGEIFSWLAITLALQSGDNRHPMEIAEYEVKGETGRFSRADIWTCGYGRKDANQPECQLLSKLVSRSGRK